MNNQFINPSESALYPINSILAIMSEEIVNKEEEVAEEVEEQEEEAQEEESAGEDELTEAKNKIKELEDLIVKNKKKSVKKEEPKAEVTSDLSQNDLYTLIKHDVHEDDVNEVVEYAKLKNIGIKEALQSNVVKSILREQEETRKTADVSNTGNTRKGATPKDAEDRKSVV